MANFLLGLLASLAATLVWVIAVTVHSYLKLRDLTGCWFQDIPSYQGRRYSIGQFTFNKLSRTFEWNGTNYSSKGEPLSEWESTHVYRDKTAKKIFSVLRGHPQDKPFTQCYAFVVMNLKEQSGKLCLADGFFQDAQETNANPQYFTLTRLKDAAAQLNLPQQSRTQGEYHRELVRQYHKMREQEESQDLTRGS
jgi:hypothetical protein